MKEDSGKKTRIPLTGLTAAEIAEVISVKEKYRSRQIFEWLEKGVKSFDEMLNLPAVLRDRLSDNFTILSSTIEKTDIDPDGTVKIAVRLQDDKIIEAVLLTDENNRKTACISSQAGCAMGCTFCRTGKMGFSRNLLSGEIVEQYAHLVSISGKIDNIVYMGMGEPLMNTDEVIKSLSYFTSEEGLGMSARRITVSTCGIVEGIYRLSTEAPPIRLAVSLVTADSEKRSLIMPVNKTNGLAELKTALSEYQKAGGRRVTLECAIIKGVNDDSESADEICRWASGLNFNVNVIPWNPADEIDFEEPDRKGIEAFCRKLEEKKVPYSRRFRRGRGLNAACGQLAAVQPEL